MKNKGKGKILAKEITDTNQIIIKYSQKKE
jgi:hypothetical protein